MESCSSSINSIHSDIVGTHILTKLDGPTLSTFATASPAINDMCNQHILWKDICNFTWTSANDPLITSLISTFPAGHRSFFSDSFPTLHHHHQTNPNRPLPASELISTVDIKYNNTTLLSKVHVTDTLTESFKSSPFWIDIINPKETIDTPTLFQEDNIENSMTLSWIIIDPTQKRAANISSLKPVFVRRNWITGDIRLRYATVVNKELEFRIGVTCGVKDSGELSIKEAYFMVLEMDGKCLSGEDSLVILQNAIGNGERRIGRNGEEKERYQEYFDLRRERRGLKERRQRKLDMVYKIMRVTLIMALFFYNSRTFILLILCINFYIFYSFFVQKK